MLRLAQEAAHKHELGGGPADRLDGVLYDDLVVVEHCHMGLATGLRLKPGALEREAQNVHKLADCRSVTAAQDEGVLAGTAASETQCTIEHDVDRRVDDTGCSGHGRIDQRFRDRADIVTQAVKRDVQTIGAQQLATQAVVLPQQMDGFSHASTVTGLRKQREEQSLSRPYAMRPRGGDAALGRRE